MGVFTPSPQQTKANGNSIPAPLNSPQPLVSSDQRTAHRKAAVMDVHYRQQMKAFGVSFSAHPQEVDGGVPRVSLAFLWNLRT
jgi:hypothetical protein